MFSRARFVMVSPSILLVVAALWPACGAEEPDVEVAEAEAAPAPLPEASAEPEPVEPELPEGVDHEVTSGQTLWDIARAYGVSVPAIMEANRLSPRDVRRLRAGQSLRVPGVTERIEGQLEAPEPPPPVEELPPLRGAAYHQLGPGETLWDVAHLYDVALHELMERNELDDEAVRRLRPGAAIIVPGVTARRVERATRSREPTTSSRGFRHTVARGETIWNLAGSFGVTVGEIMAANGLDSSGVENLREGARLWIPGVERSRSGRMERRLNAAQRRALVQARRLGLGSRETASGLLRGRVEPAWVRAAGGNRPPGTLRWPVANGWFVRGFGSGEGSYHLAVDIMGEIGWNVRAAARGIVGYAGNEVPGYGNMVLVIHPGGWVTMYAHNSANSVVAGQQVPAGGILGEVGSTGISRGPHVHFEFIHDGQNCDPAALFRPGIRHRDGRMSPIARATWTEIGSRPDAVTCHRRRRHPRSRWVVNE